MKRRLDLAASLMAKPPVLFLDEPTTGLDPRTRADVWSTIDDLVASGTTLLLTTQYLEEADRLAHRIAVMDRGKVVAEGTSDELKSTLCGDVVEMVVPEAEIDALRSRRWAPCLTAGASTGNVSASVTVEQRQHEHPELPTG